MSCKQCVLPCNNICTIPKLVNCYSDKISYYSSDCYISLPTQRSPPAPPFAEYIVPMMLGPPDQCGKPTVVPMPQPLNSAAVYYEWSQSNTSHTHSHPHPHHQIPVNNNTSCCAPCSRK